MNGQALPLLNGYPIRLVVPGWYSDLLDEDAQRHPKCWIGPMTISG